MPGDEYAAVRGGGALKLKGAKVTKPKKKKKAKALDDEKAVAALDAITNNSDGDDAADEQAKRAKNSEEQEEEEIDDRPTFLHKTEAERRFEEAKRKKLEKLAKDSCSSKPDLLKTHKERVEELNTYLSKLSEHHDMPKIGPG